MSTSQLTRAVEAIYSCIVELKELAPADHRDARLQNIEASLDKLMNILYVEKDEETGR